MSNVIAVDFRARQGARAIAPLPDPEHIVAKRVAELTRLLRHRYPGSIPATDDAMTIMAAVVDHLANLPDGLHHARMWLMDQVPDYGADLLLTAWENGGVYWRKGPLGTFIGLTIDEARACQIKTIEAKARRRRKG